MGEIFGHDNSIAAAASYVALAVTSFVSIWFLVVALGFTPLPINQLLLWVYGVANGFSFIAVTCHRLLERSSGKEINEQLIHLLEGFGGFAGSFLAHHLFRSKTDKLKSQVILWTIAAIHIAFWIWWFNYGVSWFEERIR